MPSCYKAFDLWAFDDNSKDWSNDFFNLYKGLNDNANKREAEQLAKRVLNTKSSLPLKAYAGKYTSKIYGNAEVVLNNDSLEVKLPNNMIFLLQHWHYDTFLGKSVNWWWGKSSVQFLLDSDGQVVEFIQDGISYVKEKVK